jgi:hypothetical protein
MAYDLDLVDSAGDLRDAVEALARECAALAWDQRTEDVDGTVLCSHEPLFGDWDALDDLLGGRMHCEAQTWFRQTYEHEMRKFRNA